MSGPDEHIEQLLSGLTDDWKAGLQDRDTLPGPTVVTWRTLAPEDAPAVWETLAGWVNWLIRRYQIPSRKIPTCWHQHGALVEELSALHTAWQVSFDPMDAGYGPINFHERLAAAIPRLASWYAGECHNGHTPLPHDRDTTPPAGWDDWITATHAD